jgi:hypothetical protein
MKICRDTRSISQMVVIFRTLPADHTHSTPVTVPEFISPNLSRTEEGSLARLAKALRKPRLLKLGNHTKFTRATLLLRGGKGSGRKQVPYAFYMLHHNGSVVASSKRATMQAVGHMILKHYKTKSRLTSNR